MSDNIVPIPDRPGFLAGYSTREELARKVNRTTFTILKWEKQGLPVVRRGNLRLYNDELTRKWLLGELDNSEPRKPGRPRRG